MAAKHETRDGNDDIIIPDRGDETFTSRIKRAAKLTDEGRNTFVAFVDDADMVVSVEAGKVYKFESVLLHSGDPAADLRVKVPPITDAYLGFTTDLDNEGAVIREFDDQETISSQGVGDMRICNLKGVLIMGGTAGTFALQWRQNISNATDTVLHAGSFLLLTELN